MRSFHDDPKIKEFYVNRVRAHVAANEIIHDVYWEGGRGCAVGVTIHGSDPYRYQKEFGVPVALAYIEEQLFERLPSDLSSHFPVDFLESIPVGVDLSVVCRVIRTWILRDIIQSMTTLAIDERIKMKLLQFFQQQRHATNLQWDRCRSSRNLIDEHYRVAQLEAHKEQYLRAGYCLSSFYCALTDSGSGLAHALVWLSFIEDESKRSTFWTQWAAQVLDLLRQSPTLTLPVSPHKRASFLKTPVVWCQQAWKQFWCHHEWQSSAMDFNVPVCRKCSLYM